MRKVQTVMNIGNPGLSIVEFMAISFIRYVYYYCKDICVKGWSTAVQFCYQMTTLQTQNIPIVPQHSQPPSNLLVLDKIDIHVFLDQSK
jgi:uncharacterized membrane protein